MGFVPLQYHLTAVWAHSPQSRPKNVCRPLGLGFSPWEKKYIMPLINAPCFLDLQLPHLQIADWEGKSTGCAAWCTSAFTETVSLLGPNLFFISLCYVFSNHDNKKACFTIIMCVIYLILVLPSKQRSSKIIYEKYEQKLHTPCLTWVMWDYRGTGFEWCDKSRASDERPNFEFILIINVLYPRWENL